MKRVGQSGKSQAFGMGAGRLAALSAGIALAAVLFSAGPSWAQNATWNGPGNDWDTAANWSGNNPAVVPAGTATFAGAQPTTVTFSAPTTSIGAIQFNAGAVAYTFNLAGSSLTITGAGIVNNSTAAQSFNTSGSDNADNLNFMGSSTAGNAVITNNSGGITLFQGTSMAGNAMITNNEGTTLFFNNSTASNAMITNNANGSTEFSDSSAASSATITNNSGGSTQFSGSSTAGNATITNNSGGSTLFEDASTAGNARLINNGGGIFDFSDGTGPNNNNALSAGSIEGGGVFFLGANQLTVGGNNLSTTVSGVISDCGGGADCLGAFSSRLATTGGSLVKTGSGTLTLSGVNTYTGATIVNGGTLEVDGSIATSVLTTVNSGGTLGGTGTVGDTMINGGTLAPGNSIGTLSVSGSLMLTAASTYLVQVSGTSATKTMVTGVANVAGMLTVDPLAPLSVTTTFTILTAGTVTGTFSTVDIANNFARNARLSFVGNSVLLTLDPGLLSPNLPGTANASQKNVAAAIDNALVGGATLPAAFNALFALSGTPLLNALTQASGETATGSQQTTFDAMGMFMGVMTDPFMAGRGDGPSAGGGGANGYADADALGYAGTRNPNGALAAIYTKAPQFVPFEQRWSVWTAGFGGSQTTEGNVATGSNNTASSIAGTAVGADYRFSPDTIAGFALAGGGTNFSVANGGTGHSDLFQAGAFIRHNAGPAYISAALAYGWQDITTDRTVTTGGAELLRAQFDANAYSGRVEGGYRFVAPVIGGGVGITPYAAGQFTTFDLPAYAESAIAGASAFALNYGAADVTDVRSELGIRTDKSFAVDDAILTLRGRAAWAHDYDPDRSIAATFQALPGASFVVNGAAQAADSALVTASAEMKWSNGWSAAVTFEGEFSNVTASYAGKGVVRYAW
jgi:autotransporter-associated beta strand protein